MSRNPLWETVVSFAECDSGRTALVSSRGRMTYGEVILSASMLGDAIESIDSSVGAIVYDGLCREDEVLLQLACAKLAVPFVPVPAGARSVDICGMWARTLFVGPGLDIRRIFAPSPGRISPYPPSGCMYVLGTSGSTSMPGFCAIESDSVISMCIEVRSRLGISPGRRWLAFHSGRFDFSIWEVWGALLSGGSAVLIEEDERLEFDFIAEQISAEGCEVVSLLPSVLFALLRSSSHSIWQGVSWLVLGGEKPILDDCREVYELSNRQALVASLYGLTEACVHVATRVVFRPSALVGRENPLLDSREPHWIGAPLRSFDFLVRDSDGNWSRQGQGELWISGAPVVREYLNGVRPDRFRDIEGRRWFFTGDVGSIEGGEICVLGRRGDTLKVRGKRIARQRLEYLLSSAHPALVSAHVLEVVSHGGIQDWAIYLEWTGGLQRFVSDQHLLSRIDCVLGEEFGRPMLILFHSQRLPRLASGKVDLPHLQALLQRHVDDGLRGIVALRSEY